ncbi:MAG TPA: valine--tRNA ligase [Elusimicrobiota bacterium]|nr:valine--tRNA ligase [Elusimicrobiota bacterium]
MKIELNSVYNPEVPENKWYEVWEKNGFFTSSPDAQKKPFSIVIPPPNVTGALHMGHALNNTLQDVLIRWRKMRGDNTVWVPGTDHGGIATQNVVERLLAKEKKTRHDLGREKFLEYMWNWRREAGDQILRQLRKLGCGCDWTRTRFTMDDQHSRAVTAAFVELYQRHMLYRGTRLVNWCCRCDTALADIEVEHVERDGRLWHIRYPFRPDQPLPEGSSNCVVVATTRPETMLGDTAVAVHPDDPRYKDVIGKILILPLMNREIPIVADPAVDPTFGTGAVKVTPSHDQADFEIAQRHRLPHEMVIGFNARMTDRAGRYAGQSLAECRRNVVNDLTELGLMEKEDPYRHSVAVCYRCDSIIEPLESTQWFLKTTGGLAGRAAQSTRNGRVRIFPESWEKPYLQWLDHNRDWCVSRQIWWGHKIPVWYCLNCSQFTEEQLQLLAKDPGFKGETAKMILRNSSGEPIVRVQEPIVCPHCGREEIIRDPDVLDTWFSSALWPFSVFGWTGPRQRTPPPPEGTVIESKDLAPQDYYYPTSVLVTGHEILYLWVARMVMMGEELASEVPFRHVFVHGIVRDKQGKKMSKSLGNVIDPLDVIKKYGADALRFSLATSAVPGRDMQLSDENFLAARNFANKIWNASRFVLMNLEDYTPADIPLATRDLADRWIRRRCAETVGAVDELLGQYDISAAARRLYAFFWNEFCDWYIEMAKIRLQDRAHPGRRAAQQTLVETLDGVLRALHPIMPFITEELWQSFRQTTGQPVGDTVSLMTASFTGSPSAEETGDEVPRSMGFLMDLITSVRTIRSEMNVPIAKTVDMVVRFGAVNGMAESAKTLLKSHEIVIQRLAKVASIRSDETTVRPAQSASAVVGPLEIFIPVGGLIDFEKERKRIEKEIGLLETDVGRVTQRLENREFLEKAPSAEVEKTRERLLDVQSKLKRLKGHLAVLV